MKGWIREYYNPKYYRLLQQMEKSGFPITTIREISKRVVDGPFGSEIKASDYTEMGIPFLRVADVTRGQGTIETSDRSLHYATSAWAKSSLQSYARRRSCGEDRCDDGSGEFGS